VLSSEQYGEPCARQKVPEYLEAGSKLAWLVNPANRTVRVFESGRDDVTAYSGDAEIALDQIVPGFRASISAFFPND
jgi:Uma2 family endonuclease